MKKIMTSIMASMMLLSVASAQAWCEPDNCYNPCAPYDSCAPCDPCFNRDGFYIGAFGGANFLSTDRKRHNERHNDGEHFHRSRLKFDTGYVAAVSLGYRFCNNIRTEFEYSYRHNKLERKHHHNRNNHQLALIESREDRHHGGNRNFWSSAYLVNGIWDISWCNDWYLKPFIGAGIGYATQHLSLGRRHVVIVRENGVEEDVVSRSSAKKNGFAWQILTGIAFPICDTLDLSIEYRFFKGNLNSVYNQNVGAGLRYYF